MFYCELCRTINGWPSGFWRSHGTCEMCGRSGSCYDVPSKVLKLVREDKTITLSPVPDKDEERFSLNDLIGKMFFTVVGMTRPTTRHFTLRFRRGELGSPDADPLILGTVRKEIKDLDGNPTHDYQVRALWNNKLWRVLDEDSEELVDLLAMFNKKKVVDFLKADNAKPSTPQGQ
jgi:hypothetical protein